MSGQRPVHIVWHCFASYKEGISCWTVEDALEMEIFTKGVAPCCSMACTVINSTDKAKGKLLIVVRNSLVAIWSCRVFAVLDIFNGCKNVSVDLRLSTQCVAYIVLMNKWGRNNKHDLCLCNLHTLVHDIPSPVRLFLVDLRHALATRTFLYLLHIG